MQPALYFLLQLGYNALHISSLYVKANNDAAMAVFALYLVRSVLYRNIR